ncbi:MAG: GMC family oxidoreductase N-terminal domain-containing protein [Alphaproteobacteria bacterium]|nr:GMC family oxidoreductase N-terminal domain-containing protein [Alphaproteobacteria bacterium]
MVYDFIIVGGGSAGCVLAHRLSENPKNSVLLIEAGPDTPPDFEPEEILDTYPGRAFLNADLNWSDLRVYFQPVSHNRDERPPLHRYEQGRVLGGSSSINGMIAVRGARADYDAWERLGAAGWGWDDVKPYFTRLERDLDFDGPHHGRSGPLPIRRIFPNQWDGITKAAATAFQKAGFEYVADMNGEFAEGYSPAPFNGAYGRRVTAAMAYLGAGVRERNNLELITDTTVRKITFLGKRATGVELEDSGGPEHRRGRNVVICSGAFHTPALLMRSGIGAATELGAHGIPVIHDLPGVGKGLQDHACVSVSCYLPGAARWNPMLGRHILMQLRYSSHHSDAPPTDMVLSVSSRSAWHPLGAQLGTFQVFLGKSFSRGEVLLRSADWRKEPEIRLNLLSDFRDFERLAGGIRLVHDLLKQEPLKSTALNPFPSSYSGAARRVSERTLFNRLLTRATASLMEGPAYLRRQLIRRAMAGNHTLEKLTTDDQAMTEWIRSRVTAAWHPCGTCKLGSDDDPLAVLDRHGKVRGVDSLWVADASVMPEIPRANTNIPTIMVAEKLSDSIASSVAG